MGSPPHTFSAQAGAAAMTEITAAKPNFFHIRLLP